MWLEKVGHPVVKPGEGLDDAKRGMRRRRRNVYCTPRYLSLRDRLVWKVDRGEGVVNCDDLAFEAWKLFLSRLGTSVSIFLHPRRCTLNDFRTFIDPGVMHFTLEHENETHERACNLQFFKKCSKNTNINFLCLFARFCDCSMIFLFILLLIRSYSLFGGNGYLLGEDNVWNDRYFGISKFLILK